jgi:dual specificity tyrosine-phosphorylation-regulated kinase 2/3/4
LSPPSAFNQISRRARKRTSDEFEFDQSGSLVSKSSGSGKDKAKDDKMTARRHRSLNASISSAKDIKGKDRRRDSATLTITSNVKISSAGGKTIERDAKQPSAGSTSSNVSDSHHPRRGHATDYSHLPPSPSSSSIQHFLRHSGGTAPSQPSLPHSSSKDNLQSHPPPSVAHSLLRGTQEGWSALDDEALRKLDGLTGKGARARASVGSFGRPSSSSRPGTPASKSGSQWEGLSTSDSGKSKRASGSAKDNASIKDKIEHGRTVVAPATFEPQGTEEPSGWTVPSSDEQQSHSVVPDTTPKKSNSASARLSFTPKRGSTSSTTYTSTPSSRDSAFMSAATSVTSMSAASGRHSSSKGRRNSASSDISVHSVDVKDRVAFLAVNGDPVEDGAVPPVPPLPKDLSTYRSPPVTSSALAFPSIPPDDKVGNHDSQLNRTISLEVPNYLSPPPSSSSHRESQQYPSNSVNESVPVVPKTPSKKWSFSSALNLKISSSPSSTSSQKSSFPLSPRSVTFGQQLRKSTSKDKPMSSSSGKGPWSPKQPDAMASAGSLVSLSSVGSVKTPAQGTNFSKTPERNTVSSRPGTGSSVSTNHTTSALAAPPPGRLSPTSSVRRSQSKRLTPSSIPFFRRSSSQSMQLPVPPANGVISASSPTLLSMLSTSGLKQRSSPSLDHTSPSVSTPGTSHKKHSVLSLGLPSLLKSSSRRSLHSDAKDAAKEAQKAKDAARELEKGRNKLEKERQKKEDKERSESRISMIMNRKRGKVFEIRLSSVHIIDAVPFPDFIFH